MTEVTTPEEMDTLPEGTVFEPDGRPGRLWRHSASSLDGGPVWPSKYDALPISVQP